MLTFASDENSDGLAKWSGYSCFLRGSDGIINGCMDNGNEGDDEDDEDDGDDGDDGDDLNGTDEEDLSPVIDVPMLNPKKRKRPSWTRPSKITEQLRRQEGQEVRSIFGPVQPVAVFEFANIGDTYPSLTPTPPRAINLSKPTGVNENVPVSKSLRPRASRKQIQGATICRPPKRPRSKLPRPNTRPMSPEDGIICSYRSLGFGSIHLTLGRPEDGPFNPYRIYQYNTHAKLDAWIVHSIGECRRNLRKFCYHLDDTESERRLYKPDKGILRVLKILQSLYSETLPAHDTEGSGGDRRVGLFEYRASQLTNWCFETGLRCFCCSF